MPMVKIHNTALTPAADTSSSLFGLPVPSKRIADLPERVPLRLPVLMGIDLQRHGKPGVAEDQLGVASRNPKVLQQCGGGVPQVMKLDRSESVIVAADAPERAEEVTRLDWSASPGSEDQPVVDPRVAELLAVRGLGCAPALEDLSSDAQERKVTAARGGLDGAGAQLAADTLDLLAYMDLGFVYVAPAQAEDFTAAKAGIREVKERPAWRSSPDQNSAAASTPPPAAP